MAENRAALIVHSGAYDRVMYALSVATVALAMGMEVHMLFTYDGLRRLVKGHTDDLGEETGPEMQKVIARRLARGDMQPLSQGLRDAKRMGLKVYACVAAMSNLSITRDELVPEVDEPAGLAMFLDLAKNAAINYYI